MKKYLLLLLCLFACGKEEKEEPKVEPVADEAVTMLAADDERLMQEPSGLAAEERYVRQSGLDQTAKELEADQRKMIDRVADALVNRALFELRAKGHGQAALYWEGEWVNFYQGYFSMRIMDIGDHEPWSQWLADFYADLEALLGKELCELLHFDDIWIINYAVPVVFNPKEWDQAEYKLHFVPFGGVCAYWTSYLACTIVTYGAGAWFMVCTPIGMVAERVMVRRVAPPMSDRVWLRANKGRR